MAAPPARRTLILLLLATVFCLGLALLLKDQCNQPTTGAGFSYRSLCAGDIHGLYTNRHFDVDAPPYREDPAQPINATIDPNDFNTPHPPGFLEYPVLTGYFAYTASLLGDGRDEFLYWNAAGLALLALAATWLLSRMVSDRRKVLFFCAGSPLLLYAFHNWDLLAVALTLGAIYAFENQRWATAGTLLGLAVAAKVYPIVLAPILWAALHRDHARATRLRWPEAQAALGRALRQRNGWILAATTAAAFAAAHLPALLYGTPRLVLEAYTYHLRRNPNPETFWHALHWYGTEWGIPGAAGLPTNQPIRILAIAAFLLLFAAIAWRVATARTPTRSGLLAALLLFLVFNKVFSVQYALWILPMLALVETRPLAYAFFAIADWAVYVNIIPLFTHARGSAAFSAAYRWVAAASTFRLAVLIALLKANGWPRRTRG